jgi:hypothetical protein
MRSVEHDVPPPAPLDEVAVEVAVALELDVPAPPPVELLAELVVLLAELVVLLAELIVLLAPAELELEVAALPPHVMPMTALTTASKGRDDLMGASPSLSRGAVNVCRALGGSSR